MPVLTRLIPSPVVVDIRAGALDDLAGVLADQRISALGQARRRDQRRLGRAAARAAGARAARRRLVRGRRRHPRRRHQARRRHEVRQALRRGRGPRRRQDHRLSPSSPRRGSACRWSPSPTNLVARRPVLAGRHPRQRRGPRLLRRAQPDRRRHRPRRDPRGPGPVRPLRHRRRDLQHLRDRGLGAGPPRDTASRSTAWPPPWPARRARPCCATPAASATTTSSRCSPRAWSSPASRCRSRATPGPPPAPATRSTTPSTCSSRKRAASHGEQCGLGAAFAMHLRGAHEESGATWPRCCAGTACRCCPSEIGFTEEEFVAGRGVRTADPPRALHDPGTPRPVRRPDQGRVRRLCQSHR